MKKNGINPALLIFLGGLVIFIFGMYSKYRDKSPEEIIEQELSDVTFSGSTAKFSDYVERGTLRPQDNYEYSYLVKIYHILKKGGIDKINISITDECKDSYGNVTKRYWHIKLTPDWEYWNDALNYATAEDFAMAHKDYYPLSSSTEEGTWYCCGRDPSCN